jgi:N-methylhydantoinase B
MTLCDVIFKALSNPDTPEAESINKVNAKPVQAGSLISVRTGGGGGYGNPFERDPELVRLDVVRGYVSREAAQRDYGVLLRPGTLEIDTEATRRLRSATG